MEETTRTLLMKDANDLWMGVCGILRSLKLLEDNIIKEQRNTLKEMRS